MERKVALVTGAASEVGIMICKYLCANNINVVIDYHRNKKDAEELYKYLINNLNNAMIYKCDVTKEIEVQDMINEIKKKYGSLDYVINGAALSRDNDVYDKSSKEFLDILNTNVVGPFLVSKYASLIMTSGTILNISSTDGIDTYNIYNMDYSASKSALINLTQNMASRFTSIKVLTLAPNYINTSSIKEMNPEFLKTEMRKHKQKELIDLNSVGRMVLQILLNKKIKTGSIIRMDGNNEYR